MALLESFAQSGKGGSYLTMATTHHGELKTLKYSDSRFENASVEFNEEKLRPTYKLLWGIPGSFTHQLVSLKLQYLDAARSLGTYSVHDCKCLRKLGLCREVECIKHCGKARHSEGYPGRSQEPLRCCQCSAQRGTWLVLFSPTAIVLRRKLRWSVRMRKSKSYHS